MSGLGLEDFMNQESAGKAEWFDDWKKKGEAIIWLVKSSKIHSLWLHRFMYEDMVEDKETGKQRQILRFPKPFCLESHETNERRHFRNEDGTREYPPTSCPMCRLKEWLRANDSLAVEEPIFKWVDHKNNREKIWHRQYLAGLEKTGSSNFDESLDPRLHYLFTIVDDNDPAKGIQFVRETQAIGNAMRVAIRRERDSKGMDEGNPFKNPYAFKWVYNEKALPQNKYEAFRFDRAKLRPEIQELIESDTPPDASKYDRPQKNEAMRLYSAMQRHALIDLPLDEFFEGVSLEDDSTDFPHGESPPKASTKPAETTRKEKPAEVETKPATPSGVSRTRKKKEAPKVEMIPCDECKKPMAITASVCPHCGEEYEINDDPAPQPKEEPKKAAPPKQAPKAKDQTPKGLQCWACQHDEFTKDSDGDLICQKCGINQSDDLPL